MKTIMLASLSLFLSSFAFADEQPSLAGTYRTEGVCKAAGQSIDEMEQRNPGGYVEVKYPNGEIHRFYHEDAPLNIPYYTLSKTDGLNLRSYGPRIDDTFMGADISIEVGEKGFSISYEISGAPTTYTYENYLGQAQFVKVSRGERKLSAHMLKTSLMGYHFASIVITPTLNGIKLVATKDEKVVFIGQPKLTTTCYLAKIN